MQKVKNKYLLFSSLFHKLVFKNISNQHTYKSNKNSRLYDPHTSTLYTTHSAFLHPSLKSILLPFYHSTTCFGAALALAFRFPYDIIVFILYICFLTLSLCSVLSCFQAEFFYIISVRTIIDRFPYLTSALHPSILLSLGAAFTPLISSFFT